MRKLTAALFFLMAGLSRQSLPAVLVEFSGPLERTISMGESKIGVYPEARLVQNTSLALPLTSKLYLTGSGVRTKRLLFLKFHAYVAAHYLDIPEAKLGSDPWPTLSKAKIRVMQLTFLRTVSASRIRDAFKESLSENGVDLESPFVKGVFEKLDFDMEKGGTLTLVASSRKNQEDLLYFATPNGIISAEGKDIGDLFWKMWFGKPVDSNMARLKSELSGLVPDKPTID